MFKKAQTVWQFGNWDSKGTCFYRKMIVMSCGKKQMTLKYFNSGKMLKDQIYFRTYETDFILDKPGFDPVAEALKRAQEMRADAIRKFNIDLERNVPGYKYYNENYVRYTQKQLAEVHEPRALEYPEMV